MFGDRFSTRAFKFTEPKITSESTFHVRPHDFYENKLKNKADFKLYGILKCIVLLKITKKKLSPHYKNDRRVTPDFRAVATS